MTQTHYTIRCIERAVEHMATSLQHDMVPSLEEIAAASGLSKFHFHRLYTLLTGETCQETVTRLRLARAADLLKDPTISVTQAAMAAGYGSSQAFAKAFRKLLDKSATDVRKEEDRLGDIVGTLTVPPQKSGQAPLRVELATFDPFEIITIRTEGAYPTLNETYWALFDAAGGPDNVRAILGQPLGDIASSDLAFTCGLKLSVLPHWDDPSVHRAYVAGGTFLLARHIGSYDALPDTLDGLYRASLAEDGIRIADAPPIFHYVDDPETTAQDALRTDVYLPLTLPDRAGATREG